MDGEDSTQFDPQMQLTRRAESLHRAAWLTKSAVLIAVIAGGLLASAAGAMGAARQTDPIVGDWKFAGGVVRVTGSGSHFTGVVIAQTQFSECVHRVGEEMWQISGSAGSYTGRHYAFFGPTTNICSTRVWHTATWTVNGSSLRFTASRCLGTAPPGSCADGEDILTLTRAPIRHHFRVELKAWIPQTAVVDPIRPTRTPWRAAEPGCFSPPADVARQTFFNATYRGDGHTKYDGSYRALAWVEFDWNGAKITNMRQGGLFGTTYNDIVYEMPGGKQQRCSLSKKTTKAAYGDASGASFGLRIASANPLVMPQSLSPNIDSKLDGTVSSTGVLTLRYQTDQFPSHGFRVIEDGKTIATRVITNVACLKPLGVSGAALLLKRLNFSEPPATATVSSASGEKIAPCH